MNLFAGAWEVRDVSPLPVDIPLASDNQVSHSGTSFQHFCFFYEPLVVDRITVESDFRSFPFGPFTN